MISREQLQARCLHGILVLAMGLAACNLLPDKSELLDADSDGFAFDVDCDDADPAINPDAPDMVDDEGSDVNCDGLDGADADGDGVASEVSGGEDCDDRDPLVNSNVTESCDALEHPTGPHLSA